MNMFPVQYARILHKLTDGLTGDALDTALASYVAYLKKEQALSKISYIIQEYTRLAVQGTPEEPLIVTAAHDLTTASKQAIEQQFGGTITAVTVDPSLIGGVIVRRGNIILNASIHQQLETLANSMK